MKKTIILKHQNDMKYSRDFFQMEIPKELSSTIYIIVVICLLILSVIIFGRIDDVIKTNGYIRTKENVSSVNNVIAGKIIELNFEPGEKVYKDEVLYKIDSSTYEAQRNMLINEKEDLERKINGLNSLVKSFNSNTNLCDINDVLSYSRFDAFLKNREILEIKRLIAEKEFNYENQKPETIRNSYEIGMKKQTFFLADADLNSFNANPTQI